MSFTVPAGSPSRRKHLSSHSPVLDENACRIHGDGGHSDWSPGLGIMQDPEHLEVRRHGGIKRKVELTYRIRIKMMRWASRQGHPSPSGRIDHTIITNQKAVAVIPDLPLPVPFPCPFGRQEVEVAGDLGARGGAPEELPGNPSC